MQTERGYRALKLLPKEDEFAQIPKSELKEKIIIYADKVAELNMSEVVFLEFIRKCLRNPEFLNTANVDILVSRIKNDIDK